MSEDFFSLLHEKHENINAGTNISSILYFIACVLDSCFSFVVFKLHAIIKIICIR